jgi:hypothetical protein
MELCFSPARLLTVSSSADRDHGRDDQDRLIETAMPIKGLAVTAGLGSERL